MLALSFRARPSLSVAVAEAGAAEEAEPVAQPPEEEAAVPAAECRPAAQPAAPTSPAG